jgi:hypothetical protein
VTQGNAMVEVEHREDSKRGYGKGQKMRMSFGNFLERLAAGDDTVYLTTQEARTSATDINHPVPASAIGSFGLDSNL